MTDAVLDASIRQAIAASSFARLRRQTLDELLSGAVRRRIPGRSVIHQEAEDAPHLELVVRGLVRVRVSSIEGRTMTVRYCRAGAILGAATLFTTTRPAFGIQALSASELLTLPPEWVRARADRDPEVARALLAEMSERVMFFVAELSGQAFASVSERVARHLLDLASDQAHADALLAAISQQELADAVGTAREVVVRTLRDFRSQGIVATGREGIRIIDPERLARIGVPAWNESS